MNQENKLVRISGREIYRTDKAVCVKTGRHKTWVPISLIAAEYPDRGEFDVPEWFAIKEELV